ncbi:hypothetical protein GIB67_006212 [Kingdonia uniflora]|uniref:Uncharacterized protein n=1 Tax=Kingdonia uniflora TaxID=39325 RepID=A0A7J7LCS6_9MAGN|nr:hypothetical protein GIB67_006212 [Kingdonia uniflora]
MLTGELAFGFLILNQPLLVEAFHTFPGLNNPHNTVKYAIKKLLDMNDQKAGDLFKVLLKQKRTLRSRSLRLKEILLKCEWDVVECCDGVSMVAKPSVHLGTTSNLKLHLKLNDSNIRETILKSIGLCINSGSWTGIPGYYRLTFALEDGVFEKVGLHETRWLTTCDQEREVWNVKRDNGLQYKELIETTEALERFKKDYKSSDNLTTENKNRCSNLNLNSVSFLLENVLRRSSSTIYVIALLASGQSSTITDTYSGQYIMQGFLNLKMKMWVRNLTMRCIAIIPSPIVSIIARSSEVGQLIIVASVRSPTSLFK